jgi:anaerobic ribonucleoside-triphosphate reductase activating protein
MPEMNLRMHAFEPASRANGPGLRAVVWVQGCTLNCPDCFNPATHDGAGGYTEQVDRLAAQITALPAIEGLSISGGEPFQQPEALQELLCAVRETSRLSILVFSGYSLAAIRSMPLGPKIIEQVDLLIAGPYDHRSPSSAVLLGSSNQRIHLLSERYRLADLTTVARSEIIIHSDGALTITGIAPVLDL